MTTLEQALTENTLVSVEVSNYVESPFGAVQVIGGSDEPITQVILREGTPGTSGETGPEGPVGPPGAGATPIVGFPALRAIPSVDLVVQTTGRIVTRLIGSVWSGSGWFLIAGTSADDNDTIIRPSDYAAGTNEKIWVKIWGL